MQVFRDGADEGRVRVGEGPVRNGQFVVPIHFAAGNLTATVTVVDPASGERGDTSEFSAFFPVAVSLSLAPLPELQAIDRAAPGGAEILVLPLEARALGGPVRVPSLTLEAMGSLAEDVDIVDVALYRDLDADGRIGEDDERISAPGTFDADDGSVALALEGVSVDTVAAQVWLVGLELSGAAPPASSFELAIPAPTAVAAEALFAPGSPVPVVGPFPIESDAFSVVAADLDSDGDGVFDASDECPATAGAAAVDDAGCSCDQLDARGRFPAGETLACPEPAATLLQLAAAAALLALRRRRVRARPA